MKFVIVGYGRVGTRTARVLDEEGHDVVVIERDPERADRATEDGFQAIKGDGGDETVLRQAGLDTADAVGGLTGDLNTNFAACTVAKKHGARTVLRIDEDFREEVYQEYAEDVDEVIYPERLGAAGAKTALLGGDFNVIADLTEKLQVSVFPIRHGSPAVGKRIGELDLPESGRIYAHGREDDPMTIPLPGTTLEEGDRVAVVVETEAVADVRSALLPAEA
ncbi:potassium transporter Trk [Halobacteriales archaeon QS_8_69_26]|nr:MAG: potassium transporter Trk [Halobacteriales archaeon QS_8_69_26]